MCVFSAIKGKQKQALLFEKRSKNFHPLARARGFQAHPKEQKFSGSFFQKRTASSSRSSMPAGSTPTPPI
jgi:hypothetical protein